LRDNQVIATKTEGSEGMEKEAPQQQVWCVDIAHEFDVGAQGLVVDHAELELLKQGPQRILGKEI
jgi:hypothetical protein